MNVHVCMCLHMYCKFEKHNFVVLVCADTKLMRKKLLSYFEE